jgi:uncharacterized protein YoaH (UPF0181 family)
MSEEEEFAQAIEAFIRAMLADGMTLDQAVTLVDEKIRHAHALNVQKRRSLLKLVATHLL